LFLPSLDPGLTVLDIDGGRGVPVIHALVLDHLLLADGPAFWVDARGYATTTTLARVSPSHRLLERIHVARGFTPYQHYGAITDLPAAVTTQLDDDGVARGAQHTDADQPSLIVTPAVDAQYRDDATTLAREHAKTLHARVLACLSRYARNYDVPVLLTQTQADQFTAPVEAAADHTLRCEQTRMGPRFHGDGFETTVYPVADGAYYQTTFAYWRRILAARVDQLAPDRVPTPSGGSDRTTSGGHSPPTNATADHTDTLTPTPFLDAWRNGPTSSTVGER